MKVRSYLLPSLLDRPEVQITVTSRDSVSISPGNIRIPCILVVYFLLCLLSPG